MNEGPEGLRPVAIAYTLIETAKLSGVDPQAWLTDVLSRIADHKMTDTATGRLRHGRCIKLLSAIFKRNKA